MRQKASPPETPSEQFVRDLRRSSAGGVEIVAIVNRSELSGLLLDPTVGILALSEGSRS